MAAIGSAHGADGPAAEQVAANDANTIIVTGQRTKLDALSEKILDTPQSINVVPAEIIREQGVSTLAEALRNVPGITLNAGEGGTHGDLVNLRGFSAGDDYFLDGLRDTGLYDRDSFNYESVEVLKGPASTLFGRGSTGGVINQVTKTPHLGNAASAMLAGGTNSEIRGTADLNYEIADSAAVRFAGMGMKSDVEGRPYVENKRWGFAPSVAVGLGSPTLFTLKYLHQEEDNLPDYGIPFVFGRPAPVPRSTFYGLPADDKFAAVVDVVTARFEHTFNDNLSLTDTARYGRYTFDSRQTAPTFGNANCYTTAPYAGAPLCATTPNPVPVTTFNPLFPVEGTPLNQIFVERDRPSSTGVIKTLMNSVALTAKFETGFLSHTFVIGLETDSEDASLVRFANQNTAIAPTPLLAPDPHEAFPGHQTTIRQLPVTKTQTLAGFAIDTIHIGAHWDLIGAVRYDHFRAKFDQTVGTQSHFDHTDEITSPRAALVFKPTDTSSVYFSYGTSFNPSAENLSLSASNQALPPEEDRTYEIGGKWEVIPHKFALTAAAFDTEMTNARITDPLNPSLQALSGNLKIKGVELNATGYLTPEWEITAGYTYLDASAVGLIGPGVKGPVPNTTPNQANLWTTYEFHNGVSVGTGLNYADVRDANADTLSVPGKTIIAKVPTYITWDAMASYEINDHVRLQVNGYNLTDKFYYATTYFTRPGENHVVPGVGRTVLFSVGIAY